MEKKEIKKLIKIYKAEIQMAKKSAEFWKDKIALTYQVALQRQTSYERIVEDLERIISSTENES
jgi:hypothetical protein